ncbi:methylglutaconyl-CoA hydratase [Pseudoalteromonas ulvae UL12]|uniref:Gamma-carboxygeranoyl-CoA hydratase n=1 Tax=Pseudoalteromonas ulvae TaxID=107327 RepID=A0A244CMR3_PSEDV|nr:enoyl-CoA hydratase-related protein [Pseudoalteromonas ulvae]MBE0364023.1 methylglutaconyl-CoA hydratase [Pseudoalteromonas ulvae UL12]OUL56796.1 gamma-carboxygeranoyl-CoA hydratase [Pseudoalteromonas ulvae]
MSVTLSITKSNVATIELDRQAVHNAFDDTTIGQLIETIEYAKTLDIRALVLKSAGKHFSAGADLAWMKSMADNSFEDNLADSKQLAKLMSSLHSVAVPTLCLVQGAAFGGAIGLIACCDIAICTDDAKFCLSEVKLGLIPAVISPYVIQAIGERQARRYFLTAEVFKAPQAQQMGLIQIIDNDLESAANTILQAIIDNGPAAVRAAKQLISAVAGQVIDESLTDYTAQQIASIRVSEEGQEGLSAFFAKRAPSWQQ